MRQRGKHQAGQAGAGEQPADRLQVLLPHHPAGEAEAGEREGQADAVHGRDRGAWPPGGRSMAAYPPRGMAATAAATRGSVNAASSSR